MGIALQGTTLHGLWENIPLVTVRQDGTGPVTDDSAISCNTRTRHQDGGQTAVHTVDLCLKELWQERGDVIFNEPCHWREIFSQIAWEYYTYRITKLSQSSFKGIQRHAAQQIDLLSVEGKWGAILGRRLNTCGYHLDD